MGPRRQTERSDGTLAEGRGSQLLRGVLDMCLLALISEEPCYGYEMVRKLEERGLHLVSEGTIYPLLSRLERHGLVGKFVSPSSEGPSRKYYRITHIGEQALDAWVTEWAGFAGSVDGVLKGAGR